MNKIVVTRHPALVQYLKEIGIIDENTPVLEHATKEDVAGKHVIGVLPLELASEAKYVTTINLNMTKEHRSRELTLEDMKEIAGEITTYKVSRMNVIR